MPIEPIGYFQIRANDSIMYPIRKNHIISQTYISDFKGCNKIVITLPWQFRLSKTINVYLDDNLEKSGFEQRINSETKPAYLFINGTKIQNTNVLDMAWSDIIS